MNGYNLIEEGHTIWGTIMCSLTLAPIGIMGPLLILYSAENKLCTILLILLLYVLAVPIATVCYILFVLVVGAIKVWTPNLSEVEDVMFGQDGDLFLYAANMFRIAEIVTESCPQSGLGNRTHFENDFVFFLQKGSTSSCTWDLQRTPGHELFSSSVWQQVCSP